MNRMLDRALRLVLAPYLGVIFLATAIAGYSFARDFHKFIIGDWAINYSAGFVRRGLMGEVLGHAGAVFGMSLPMLAYAVQMLCYAIFFLSALALLLKQRHPAHFALLIFSPTIFLFQVYDPIGGYRKEVLYFALLALNLLLMRSTRVAVFRACYTVSMVVLFPMLVLSHEMLIAWYPFMLMPYFFAAQGAKPARTCIMLLGTACTLIAFIASIATPFSQAQVDMIHQSLHHPMPTEGAIDALSLTAGYGVKLASHFISTKYYIEVYSAVLLLTVLGFIPLKNHCGGRTRRFTGLRILACASFAATAVLFAVMGDWGRLIYILAVSVFLTAAAFHDFHMEQEVRAEPAFSTRQRSGDMDTQGDDDVWLLRRGPIAFIILVLAYGLSWYNPHCGGLESIATCHPIARIVRCVVSNSF